MDTLVAIITKINPIIILVAVFFDQCTGLEIAVSRKDALLPTGSNQTISCSDERPFNMDWLLGRSHLSSCLLTPESKCQPGGRFVVRPEINTFQLNLINLALHDCGTYTCKVDTVRETYTLELIEHVKMANLSETDHSLTVTTSCVVPGYTVDIRWYYILKDGTTRLFDQPTMRLERTDVCSGACIDNNMVRVSSKLHLPTVVNHPVLVKLRAIILQDGRQWSYTSTRDYYIEGCPTYTVDTVILALLSIVCIMCGLHLGTMMIHMYTVCKDRSLHLDSSRWYRAVICGILFVCGIADIITIKKVTLQPEACDNQYSVQHVTAVIVYILIAAATSVKEVQRYRKRKTKLKDVSGGQTTGQLEMQPVEGLVNQSNPSNLPTETCTDTQQTPIQPEQSTIGNSGTGEQTESKKSSIKTFSFAEQWKKECNATLSGSVHNDSMSKVNADVGKRVILGLNSRYQTNDYPSWQKLHGDVLNYEGHKKFLSSDGRLAWDDDKRSIIISDVRPSDAGTYVSIVSGGDIQTVDLVVYLAKKTITVFSKSSFLLDAEDCIQGPYPQWRRWCVVNTRFHKNFNERFFYWDKDKKSLVLKDVRAKDEGLYEVSSNNCVQEFVLRVKPNLNDPVSLMEVKAGINVRLECPNEDETYPSWHCVKYNIFNEAGCPNFLQPKSSETSLVSRFGWSIDERSLLIKDVRLVDSGNFICRMADGTCLTFELIVKATPKIFLVENETVSDQP